MAEQLAPLPAEVTDQVTAQMCAETGHSCIACPIDVRSLAASAHNALGAVRAAIGGHGSWERAARKLGYLESALEKFRPALDGHVEALDDWRRP